MATYGIELEAFTAIVARAREASSMKGNPIELTEVELLEILHNAL